MTCIHHYSITQNSFTALKILCAPSIHSVSPNPWKPLIFLVSITVPFTECHILTIIEYVKTFLLRNVFRFLHIFSWLESSFLLVLKKTLVWMYHCLFIHSLAEGHFGCFQVSAIMNEAAINTSQLVFMWTCISISYSFLGVELLDHVAHVTFSKTATLFSKISPFYSL